MNLPHNESVSTLHDFVKDVIEPSLVWHAGRNAESLRTMAIQALCSIGEGAPKEAYEIYPNFILHLLPLIDDNNAVTRAYSIRCLIKCGPVKFDDAKSLIVREYLLSI